MNIKKPSGIPDLTSQLESLFDQVWRSESDWRLWDRIDAIVPCEVRREKRDLLRDPTIGPDITAEKVQVPRRSLLDARAGCVVLLAVIGLIVMPAAAQAKVNGGCTATATASNSGTVDLTAATTWHVKDADVLSGQANAPTAQKFAQLKVFLFGIGLPLLDKSGNASSGSAGPYRISDYDRYTRVLSVGGTSTSCDGNILIVVDDVAPLATWAGILGLIASVLGLVGLIASLFQFPSGSARIVSMVVGVVAGVGLGLLLQETAVLDPANILGLLLPAGGAFVGLIVPGLTHRRGLAASAPL